MISLSLIHYTLNIQVRTEPVFLTSTSPLTEAAKPSFAVKATTVTGRGTLQLPA